ncbi:hypothetical protein OBE_15620, partial [human gut metagenome]
HINNNDRGKILIHKELAEKNNLKLNDKIKLQLIDFNNSEKKSEYEFEIIGIFSGKNKKNILAYHQTLVKIWYLLIMNQVKKH